jgi:hypothetical protein
MTRAHYEELEDGFEYPKTIALSFEQRFERP